MEENKNIDLGNDIPDILGNPPSWLLRYGISIVFLIILLIGILSWIIKYPDFIIASIFLTTENPPIEIVAKQSGKITSLKVKDQEYVKLGDVLATIESTTSESDLVVLINFINKISQLNDESSYLECNFPKNLSLGNLSALSSSIDLVFSEIQYLISNSPVRMKIKALEDKRVQLVKINESMKKQISFYQSEFDVFKEDYNRNKVLSKQGVVSQADFDKLEISFIQYNRQLEALNSNVLNNELQIQEISIQILDLSHDYNNTLAALRSRLNQAISNILSEIEIWKDNHILISPIAGKISFGNIYSEKQFVRSGEVVFTVVPDTMSNSRILAKGFLPIQGSGKIEINNPANITLSGYPSAQFGMITTTVSKISLTPIELEDKSSVYLIEMELPKSLKTSYNKEIPFKQGMTGSAEIIVDNRRIIEKIFDRITSIFRNQ